MRVDESSNTYYYPNFRCGFCHRWAERSLNDCLGNMQKVEEEERVTVCHRMASDNGFTGVSLLNRLKVLYGFDVLKDMVFDAMHTLILGVVLRHLQFYKEHGLLGNPVVQKRLEKITWTVGFIYSYTVLLATYVRVPCMYILTFITM